ncbi:MAG: T9SS type A sorting domain-containing protein, partial [Ignavibacteria bacterium]|nr:T9SS type A sorting domain-containing protein [Ignavibacteria bacterium]
RAFVNITVYDVRGKEVQTLVNEETTAGKHSVNFHSQNLSSGIYFTKMSINGKSQKIIKMMFIK